MDADGHSLVAATKAGGRALARGLSVLEAVVDAGKPVTLGEVAAMSELPKPTTHRLLRVLQARGYVWQDEGQCYLPSHRLLRLAGQLELSFDSVRVVTPLMRNLQRTIPETIHFALRQGDIAVYVQKLDGDRPYRMSSAIGLPLDLHTTAIGKAILANLPDAERAELIDRLPLRGHTAHTLTSVNALRKELNAVRDRGFAIDNEEDEDDMRCVGAAVFDHRGRVIGGISVSAPAFKLPLDEAIRVGPTVTSAAADISVALGHPAGALPGAYVRRHLTESETPA
jgi:IclR family transcriptional regulator, acetate operon repressor